MSNGDSFPDPGSSDDLRAARTRRSVLAHLESADGLLSSARAQESNEASTEAEALARRSLADFRSALDWAEDGPDEADCHQRLDAAGRWVRETFGCSLSWNGSTYYDTCPVSLGHTRMGFSIGGTVERRICSLCGQDLSNCQHVRGTAYYVPGGTGDLGWCRVCLETACTHSESKLYRAEVIAMLSGIEVTEVSLVSKPDNPLARVQILSVSCEDLREFLGPEFEPGMEVSCDRCLQPCDGLHRPNLNHPDPSGDS